MYSPEELEQHFSNSSYDAIYCGLHEGKPLLYQRYKEACTIGYPSFMLCDPDDPYNLKKIEIITDESLELLGKARKVMKARKII